MKKLGDRRERIAEAAAIAGERRRRKQAARSNALQLPSRPARMVSGWRAGSARTRHRGPRYPRIERSGIARTPARQDRPSRHRAAQTRLSRLAARRTLIIARWSRSRQLRRRMPSGRTGSARRWSERRTRIVNRMKAAFEPARHPRLQSQTEEGRRAPRRFAHARG